MERFTVALPDRTTRRSIGAALDRYIAAGPGLCRRLAELEDAGAGRPLSMSLQDELYDKRGLPG